MALHARNAQKLAHLWCLSVFPENWFPCPPLRSKKVFNFFLLFGVIWAIARFPKFGLVGVIFQGVNLGGLHLGEGVIASWNCQAGHKSLALQKTKSRGAKALDIFGRGRSGWLVCFPLGRENDFCEQMLEKTVPIYLGQFEGCQVFFDKFFFKVFLGLQAESRLLNLSRGSQPPSPQLPRPHRPRVPGTPQNGQTFPSGTLCAFFDKILPKSAQNWHFWLFGGIKNFPCSSPAVGSPVGHGGMPSHLLILKPGNETPWRKPGQVVKVIFELQMTNMACQFWISGANS